MSKCVQSVPTWAACQFSAFELPPPSPQSARVWSWHDPSLKWLQRSHSKSRSRRKSCVPSVSPRDVLHQWWPKIRDPLIALASFRAWYCEVKPPKLIKAVWSKWWKNLRQTDCQLEPLPVGLFKSQIKSKKPCNSWLVGVTSPGYRVSGLVTFHQRPARIPFLFPNQGTASEQDADPLVTTPSAGHSSPGRKEMTSPTARFVLWKSWESVTHSDRSQKSNDHLLKILFRSFKLKICANTNHHLLLTVRLGLINPQCMNISGGSQNNDISPSKRYIQN